MKHIKPVPNVPPVPPLLVPPVTPPGIPVPIVISSCDNAQAVPVVVVQLQVAGVTELQELQVTPELQVLLVVQEILLLFEQVLLQVTPELQTLSLPILQLVL
ncbi:hypothetical protein CCP3SC5AM1_700013 [Gammaproteobacteria bacterium]